MKIIDCITYFDEPLLFEIRVNTLSDYVDQFIVCEAEYTHAGKKKNLNFDINRYKKFKDKINYIVVDQQPDNLFDESKIDKTNNQFYRLNAQRRIHLQREAIFEELSKNDKEDWIIYSDSDEIPNLKYFRFNKCKKKVVLFNQKLFYYKFNLTLTDNSWFGSKACKLKNLKSISALRNIKPKKYGWWRLDTFFKKNKFIDLEIVKNGGWHFSEVKTPEEIYKKHNNDEHHDEFYLTGINLEDVKKMVQERYIHYDHNVDKKDLKNKWSKENKISLTKIEDNFLPKYLRQNKEKLRNWFDNN